MQQCEILLAFVMPDYKSGWDASNDFSNKDILGSSGTTDDDGTIKGIVTPYVPVYVNGELYYGYEPDGTYADGMGSAQPPVTQSTTATKPTEETEDDLLPGDTNCDGNVDLADAVLIMQYNANPDEYGLNKANGISDQGAKNADVIGDGDGITNLDALQIQKFKLGLIESL